MSTFFSYCTPTFLSSSFSSKVRVASMSESLARAAMHGQEDVEYIRFEVAEQFRRCAEPASVDRAELLLTHIIFVVWGSSLLTWIRRARDTCLVEAPLPHTDRGRGYARHRKRAVKTRDRWIENMKQSRKVYLKRVVARGAVLLIVPIQWDPHQEKIICYESTESTSRDGSAFVCARAKSAVHGEKEEEGRRGKEKRRGVKRREVRVVYWDLKPTWCSTQSCGRQSAACRRDSELVRARQEWVGVGGSKSLVPRREHQLLHRNALQTWATSRAKQPVNLGLAWQRLVTADRGSGWSFRETLLPLFDVLVSQFKPLRTSSLESDSAKSER
ncbi:hypothetical protein B0H17DRAFT_1146652 [Mycena rosella]|uniref:Uncharacterized protein n=1 Tax=Mycena rosella TaxID=1033263 RepID=A0AAD7CNJ2_MYCRO|nr:hypothetical protein B0H17DRAFT_1146652 [Mycena rosella]